jgi:hypothetical protein
MKTVIPLLTLIVLTSLEVQAGDYPSTTGFCQSNHTSIIIAPATTNWVNMKTPSTTTNWPATNRPAILSPPTGFHVQAGN